MLKVFWNDGGRGLDADGAKEVNLEAAKLIWSDEVRGVKDNFLGLIDEGNTIQFYYDESIPDDVGDASHLKIVLLDFPVPEKRGSYAARVAVGDVFELIEKAFRVGADYSAFEVTFEPW